MPKKHFVGRGYRVAHGDIRKVATTALGGKGGKV
jgi:hypothetical protein